MSFLNMVVRECGKVNNPQAQEFKARAEELIAANPELHKQESEAFDQVRARINERGIEEHQELKEILSFAHCLLTKVVLN